MEMTFPHPVKRNATRHSHRAMLAVAIARQSNTKTAVAVLLATKFGNNNRSDSALDQRILYFGSHKIDEFAASGPFWTARRSQGTARTNYESRLYQDGLMNNKAHELNGDRSWRQFIKPGHGASRTI